MFPVEHASHAMNVAIAPYYATEMANALRASNTDLDHPDKPAIVLIRRGFPTRVVAFCVDHAVRLAKEDARHAAPQQQQLVP